MLCSVQPDTLLLSDWKEADKSLTLPSHYDDSLADPDDISLLAPYKLAYQANKDGKTKIALMISSHCVTAIRKLIDVRLDVGVSPSNVFVFPLTEQSLGHCNGWKAMTDTCAAAGVADPALFTAIKQPSTSATLSVSSSAAMMSHNVNLTENKSLTISSSNKNTSEATTKYFCQSLADKEQSNINDTRTAVQHSFAQDFII